MLEKVLNRGKIDDAFTVLYSFMRGTTQIAHEADDTSSLSGALQDQAALYDVPPGAVSHGQASQSEQPAFSS